MEKKNPFLKFNGFDALPSKKSSSYPAKTQIQPIIQTLNTIPEAFEKLELDQKPKGPTKFKENWVASYPWANYEYNFDEDQQIWQEVIYCTVCRQYSQELQNKLEAQIIKSLPRTPILAKGSLNVKIETLSEHASAKCSYHIDAQDFSNDLNLSVEDREIQRNKKQSQLSLEGNSALINSARQTYQYQQIKSHLSNAFFLAEHNLALGLYEPLQALSKDNGIEMNQNYQNRKAADEFLLYICEVVLEKLLQNINSSSFIAISIDSSSTISKKEIMCMCVKYINENCQIEERYLSVQDMDCATAVQYLTLTLKILEQYGLKKKLYFLATDGAPVMVSKNGLAGKLKEIFPHLITIHCKAHKAALGIKELAQQFNIIKDLNFLVYHVVSSFNSPKRKQWLTENQINLLEINDDETLGLIQPFDVRWISYFPAIQRIISQLLPVIITLKEILDTDYNPNQKNYYDQLCDINTIIKLAHYADMLQPVFYLTKFLQQKQLTLDAFELEFDTCKKNIEKFTEIKKIHKGSLIQLIESKITRSNQKTKYENQIDLTAQGSFDQHHKKIHLLFVTISQQLIENLITRFEDIEIFKNFRAFCIPSIKVNKNNTEYGIVEIKKLFQFYRTQGNSIFDSLDREQIIEQYRALKLQINGALKEYKYSQFLQTIEQSVSFSEISNLFKLYYTLPLTSVECERVFSQVGIIITKQRNSLSCEHLNQLLMISRNGGSREQFDFQKAFVYWQQGKKRRFV